MKAAIISGGWSFWRGYPALLLAFAAAHLTQQIDMVMLAKLVGTGAPAAYVILIRVAALDMAVMTATGAVTSVMVGATARAGKGGDTVPRLLGLAAGIGVGLGLIGLLAYGRVVAWIGGGGDAATLAQAAVPWFALAAPFRMLNATASFSFHALERGGMVVRWRLVEAAAKLALNAIFIVGLQMGLMGCFIAGFIVSLASSLWALARLKQMTGGLPRRPDRRFLSDFAGKTGWEFLRTLSAMLLALTAVALFAAPIGSGSGPARLDAFAAGSVAVMLLFAPLVAQLRYVAMRLAGASAMVVFEAIPNLLRYTVPIALAVAVLLFVGKDWLGAAVYGKAGPWWSWLMAMAALSLPLRVVANTLRAALQAVGRFAVVTQIDTVLTWVLTPSLIIVGLYLNQPPIAYAFFLGPEILALGFFGRLAFRMTDRGRCL